MLNSNQGAPLGGVATFRTATGVGNRAGGPSAASRSLSSLSDKVNYDTRALTPPSAPPHVGLFRRALKAASTWLDRVIEADERIVCAACDDRFWTQEDGVAHVLRHHPEYRGVMLYDETVKTVEGNLRLATVKAVHTRP